MDKTIFEKIVSREIPAQIIFEDDQVIAILDIAPKALGHTLVIPKAVSRNLLDMNKESLGHYFTIVQKVAQAIKSSLNSDGINVITNIEPAAGQEVFHTHIHVIPRHLNDSIDMNPGHHQTYSSQSEMEEYAEKIKAHLI